MFIVAIAFGAGSRGRAKVVGSLCEFVGDRQRRETTDATALLLLIVEALGEQTALEGESVEW